MAKRKAGGRPAAKTEAPARTKFDVEERFDDSEDEFQTGRDQILLDEAPDAKRRRKVADDGMIYAIFGIRKCTI
jgi:U3 small nucleolar RNA-associated protein 3